MVRLSIELDIYSSSLNLSSSVALITCKRIKIKGVKLQACRPIKPPIVIITTERMMIIYMPRRALGEKGSKSTRFDGRWRGQRRVSPPAPASA